MYGTFNALAELVLKREGDIRQLTGEFLQTGATSGGSLTNQLRPQIVLIDEVDVFFNPEFYGQMFV